MDMEITTLWQNAKVLEELEQFLLGTDYSVDAGMRAVRPDLPRDMYMEAVVEKLLDQKIGLCQCCACGYWCYSESVEPICVDCDAEV